MVKILIVEDEFLIAQALSNSLEFLHYEVTGVVASFEDMILSIEQNQPDIILMDILINGSRNGIESADEIRKRFRIPVIFLTGHSQEELFQQAVQVEPDAFILKPYKIDDLKIAIEIAYYKHLADEKIKKRNEEINLKEMILLRYQHLISLGELTASIAHEIRQPLQIIKLLSESMIFFQKKNNQYNDYLEEIFDYFNKISLNVDKIDAIISNLYQYTRLHDKNMKKEIDINESIVKIAGFFNEQLKSRSILLELNLDNRIKKLQFSEHQMEEIWINLITNAIHAHETVDKKDKLIIIQTSMNNNEVIVEVADNAAGINDGIKKKNLEMIYSDKNPDNTKGLGYYIVYNILSAYNAEISVKNNSLNGTTFTIIFKEAVS